MTDTRKMYRGSKNMKERNTVRLPYDRKSNDVKVYVKTDKHSKDKRR